MAPIIGVYVYAHLVESEKSLSPMVMNRHISSKKTNEGDVTSTSADLNKTTQSNGQ